MPGRGIQLDSLGMQTLLGMISGTGAAKASSKLFKEGMRLSTKAADNIQIKAIEKIFERRIRNPKFEEQVRKRAKQYEEADERSVYFAQKVMDKTRPGTIVFAREGRRGRTLAKRQEKKQRRVDAFREGVKRERAQWAYKKARQDILDENWKDVVDTTNMWRGNWEAPLDEGMKYVKTAGLLKGTAEGLSQKRQQIFELPSERKARLADASKNIDLVNKAVPKKNRNRSFFFGPAAGGRP